MIKFVCLTDSTSDEDDHEPLLSTIKKRKKVRKKEPTITFTFYTIKNYHITFFPIEKYLCQ